MISPAPIRLADLTLGYDRHPAVHHLSGVFQPGSLTAVVGPNGAGKSTLLKAIAGLLPVLSGSIERGDQKRGTIAYLPQSAEIDRSFPITVSDFVGAGLWRSTGAFGVFTGADRRRRIGALATVGLNGFESRTIGTLSGGQMQRALFARLILQDCPVVLLDEPFASLDAATLQDLLALLLGWHGQGRTVVAVVHDFELVRQNFPQALLLAREPVAWGPAREVLSRANLDRAQGMAAHVDPGARPCTREPHVQDAA